MKKLIIIAILVVIGWYGNQLYQKNQFPILQTQDTNFQSSSMTKCIAQDGKVYYGKISEDIDCDRIEKVKGSVQIISSNQFKYESTPEESSSFQESSPKKSSSRYSCTGKQHCSQMSSCEEAKFYIKNCPNTKMDGDHDGIPCERQICGHW
ncbi:excalibur calcium-binding domain-containing protein [Pelagibaculum spongiae]|uniref:Excalibur calcium-binding domain-containing protein n=1 Tax=Pelagibaculum spongiae TaxID=2080658 RepID=A0A2V1GU32_9GAMM|nr:excalibur calcium-binding domain-containing protein [Pelagibaculum spongiae]PVZ65688.1 hypothetical protein DC094_17540 [Pelagibaculum spongiae]